MNDMTPLMFRCWECGQESPVDADRFHSVSGNQDELPDNERICPKCYAEEIARLEEEATNGDPEDRMFDRRF